MSEKQENLTGGRRLARNVFWNLLGTGTPLLAALFAIPILIDGLGLARFGILTLAWMVVGYFSLFDLGLGRALTKLVAEKLGQGKNADVPGLVWTAMLLMALLGALGGGVFAALSAWIVGSALTIPPELQAETLTAFYLLAASVPAVIITTGLRGMLEAHQRFGLVNAVRVPLGIFTFLGPVAVLPFSNSLVPVILVLVLARVISGVIYAALCVHVEPALRRLIVIRREMLRPLISFGGWMTVTNIVGPLMVYLDRFLIGAVITMAAVAYYATPYEVVTKLWIVPGAFMGVLFPAFAAAIVQDRNRAALLLTRAVNYIFLSTFPIVLIIVTFAHEGLTLWLGYEFAANSALVLQLLAIGVFINSHAQVLFGLVQSAGRADLTAKLHLAELPFYLLCLWWLLDSHGIIGAAIAWVARIAVDAILLFVMTHKLLPVVSLFRPQPVFMAGIAFLMFVLGGLISGLAMKGLFLTLVILLFALVAWFIILNAGERNVIRSRFKLKPAFD